MLQTIYENIFRAVFPHKDAASVKREYQLPDSINVSLRLTPDGWFSVTMPDHPGLVTQANSHQGLLEMVNDAILTYYDVPRTKANVVYDRLDVGDTVVQYRGRLQTKQA